MEPRALIEQDALEAVRRFSPAVVEALRGRSVFLTGGTGFIGKWLLEILLRANAMHDLGMRGTVLTRDPAAFVRAWPHLALAPGITLHPGNVEDFDFPPGRFDLAIHAALPVATLAQEGADLAARARSGMARICAFSAQAGVARLLHVSSGAVYGAQASAHAIPEGAPWSEPAANEYTRAKRDSENYLAQGQWPFTYSIARCFAFIGPYLEPSSGSAAAQFVRASAAGEGIVIQGDGAPVRSYQYASDMARWLVTMLAVAPAGTAFNVGSGEAVTIRQLAEAVAALSGPDCDVTIQGLHRAGLAGNAYVPSVLLARDQLALENPISLNDAIARTLAWRRANQILEETAS